MQDFDINEYISKVEDFVSIVMADDVAFYGILAVVALLLILVVWKLFSIGSGKQFEIEDEYEEEAAPKELVDKVIDEAAKEAGAERIEEPILKARPEDGLPLDKPVSKTTDTVEVLRHLSTEVEGGEEFETRPIGTDETITDPQVHEVIPPVLKEDKKPEITPEPVKVKPKKKAEPAKAEVEEKVKPKTLEQGLAKTKGGFMSKLNKLVFGAGSIDDDIMEELEEILYEADIGQTATHLFETVTEQLKRKELKDPARIKELLKAEITRILEKPTVEDRMNGDAPQVIMMVGVNGVGKTTTIGKLARQYRLDGKKVLLAAGDTFRAAAVEQLEVWSQRSEVEIITAKEGANPSGVLYNAVEAAKARDVDIMIADTAGRLHTKYNLMEELRKMHAVTAKALGREPNEIWLVIDANTGQNAVNQAAKFNEALGLTGLILTKLDGTAKGGVVIGIIDQLGLPIKYIGIGEGVEDLRPFDAKEFVEELFK